MSKHKNIFAKGYFANWSEEVLWLREVKTLFVRHILLVILKTKKLFERFTKKSCKKQMKKYLELKK